MSRQAEQRITVRSDRAARRLALLTRDGRSQASVIEEAVERMPLPSGAEADLRTRIEAILDGADPGATPSAVAFDAREYDDRGNPR